MAVEGVNNSNNNAGLYAAGAALVGGAGAGAAGYYSKPYLKDGAPTDSFSKKIVEIVQDAQPKELKEFTKPMVELNEKLASAKNIDEYKKHIISLAEFAFNQSGDDVDVIKTNILTGAKDLEQLGLVNSPEFLASVENAATKDEILGIVKKNISDGIDGQDFAELQKAAKQSYKEIVQSSVDSVWDSANKTFVKEIEGNDAFNTALKNVKKAAKDIQLKTAGIYGGITAAVLGLGTYLIANNKKSE